MLPSLIDAPGDTYTQDSLDSGAQAGPSPARDLSALLIAGGLVGLIAAVVLLVEKIKLIENPDYIPSCSINPILSCGSVMTTSQAEAFGFPNPIIGVAAFAALLIVGLGMLAGAAFQRWFWVMVQAGVTFAVVFVHWLIYQSLYVIGALCPYCMIVWAVTIPIFWHSTVYNLQSLRSTSPVRLERIVRIVTEYRGAILTAWYLTIITMIAQRFWDYWKTLLTLG